MRVRGVLLVAALSVLVVAFESQAIANAVIWTNGGTITDLAQQGGNYSFVNFGVTGNESGCTDAPSVFYFTVSDDKTKRMFSMLLAAQAAGRRVRLLTTGTCNGWAGAEIAGVIVIS